MKISDFRFKISLAAICILQSAFCNLAAAPQAVYVNPDGTIVNTTDFKFAPGKLFSNGVAVDSSLAAKVDKTTTVNTHPLSANVIVTQSDVGLGNLTNDPQTKAAIVPNTVPAAGQVLVGNPGGTAYAPQVIIGDATFSANGTLIVTKTNGVSFATSATTDTTNAANISSGTLPAARLPNPSASTLGGIQSKTAAANQWINSISTSGVPSSTQPAFTDISGTATNTQVPPTLSSKTFDDTNIYTAKDGSFTVENTTTPTKKFVFDLSNISAVTTRTVNIPDANSTTAQAKSSTANQFLTAMSAQGVFTSAQPAIANLSDAGQLATYAAITPGTGMTTWWATPTSANLAAAVTNETGSGALVFGTSPTLVTPVLGAATATTINGVTLDNNAWTSYTPAITTSTGTITTLGYNVGSYKQIGKTIIVRIDFAITTNGTGAGELRAALPFTAAANQYAVSGQEYTNKKGISGLIGSSGTYTPIFYYDGTYPGANGRAYNIVAVYEVP